MDPLIGCQRVVVGRILFRHRAVSALAIAGLLYAVGKGSGIRLESLMIESRPFYRKIFRHVIGHRRGSCVVSCDREKWQSDTLFGFGN